MTFKQRKKWILTALCGVAISLSSPMFQSAFAQSHSGGQGGGGHMSESDHGDDHGAEGKKMMGGGSSQRGGASRGSLRDVFNEMEEEAVSNPIGGHGGSQGGKKTGKPATAGGQPDTEAEADEDSDRPPYAGTPGSEGKPGSPNQTPGTKRGDIYGDMYVIERNPDGTPLLDASGYEQVYYVDADGNVVCCIPRDDEGNLLPTLEDGTPVVPLEVELGRLSVSRSSIRVLSAQYDAAIDTILSATSVSLDPAGRIVVTLSDGTVKTIDSPLENLAIYYELINTGTIADLEGATNLGDLSFLADGTLTNDDLNVAASLFAAASDKAIPVTVDTIEYMNEILGVDGTLAGDFVDYTSYTYDRESVYGDMTMTVLVETSPGVFESKDVNVYEAVFNSVSTDTDPNDPAVNPLTNVAAFTTATDDARLVIDYLHEYAPPATE